MTATLTKQHAWTELHDALERESAHEARRDPYTRLAAAIAAQTRQDRDAVELINAALDVLADATACLHGALKALDAE